MSNPDTNTLNGSLEQLGITLADNLTTMGVTSSSSEGLTTLANKILSIDTGGVINLTSNKSILSYMDSESATLTANYNKGAGHSLEIYNATTGTKIGDMTDNDDGTYSYTYNSANNGDISMTAVSGQTESNSISIEDCTYYDPTNTDKSNRYSTNIQLRNNSGGTFTYNNNGYYIGTVTSSTSGETGFQIATLNNDTTDFTLEFDGNMVNPSNKTSTLGLGVYIDSNNFYTLKGDGYSHVYWIGKKVNGSYSENSTSSNVFNENEWIHYKCTIQGTTMTMTATNSSNQTVTWSQTIPTRTTGVKYCFPITWSNGCTWEVKNIKIKPL